MQDVFILTGPTGSGKSELGLTLAERLGAEIVAMDSMTLYRGMDIGTAKPAAADRRRVPHHLVDVLEPWESASVAWWLGRALERCQDIQGRGHRVLFVGGTPLYLKALLRGLFDGPPANAEIRRRLETEAAVLGKQALHDRLAQLDGQTAARLHPNDQRRVIRALEVFETTGRPISDFQQQWSRQIDSADSSARCLWLDLPRSELYARINARVQRMIDGGLVDEVRVLRKLRQPLSKEASQALGYKELFAYLDGQTTLEQAIQCIQTRTRNFAKRQITWLRHLPECRPVSAELTFTLWAT
jgi:tRNA dimethylallyltransferase